MTTFSPAQLAEKSISASTVDKWTQFLIQKKGKAAFEEIKNNLSPESLDEFQKRASVLQKYSHRAFNEFCEKIGTMAGGHEIGIAMGEYSAVETQRTITPILRSVRKDAVYFLSDRINAIHRLYYDTGVISFDPLTKNGGDVLFKDYLHPELLCYSNAGYTKKCLELAGIRGAKILNVKHSPSPEFPCRIRMQWA